MSDPGRMLSVVPPPNEPPPDGEKGPEDDVHLTLMDHLRELRKRIMYSAYAITGAFALTYYFSGHILAWLMTPVQQVLPKDGSIVMTHPTEAFFTYVNVAMYAAVALVSPILFYQFYQFIAPGLYRSERRMMVPFVTMGGTFFIGGILFARYVILPFALEVLVKQYTVAPMGGVELKPFLAMTETLDFVLMVLLAFGVIFELPLILALLARFGIVSSAFLAKYRRHAVVVNTIIAAVVTPTGDAVNLSLMAVPLVIFYELGIIGARMMERRKEGKTVLLTFTDVATIAAIAGLLYGLFYLISRFTHHVGIVK